MDARRFDVLTRTLSSLDTRRRLLGALAALPLAGGLVTLLEPEDAEARKRRERRKDRHRRRRDKARGKRRTKHRRGCKPKSQAKVCAGRCGLIQNRQTCGKPVDCGSCACTPPCGECLTCQAGPTTPGTCVPDPAQVGAACGSAGQVCQPQGTCACEAGSCANPTPVCAQGTCVACSATQPCPSGCCDDATGTCVADCPGCLSCVGGVCAASTAKDGACCGIGQQCAAGVCTTVATASLAACEGQCKSDSDLGPITAAVCGVEVPCPPCTECAALGCSASFRITNGPRGTGSYCRDGSTGDSCGSDSICTTAGTYCASPNTDCYPICTGV
jgi:hypothetical protein